MARRKETGTSSEGTKSGCWGNGAGKVGKKEVIVLDPCSRCTIALTPKVSVALVIVRVSGRSGHVEDEGITTNARLDAPEYSTLLAARHLLPISRQ